MPFKFCIPSRSVAYLFSSLKLQPSDLTEREVEGVPMMDALHMGSPRQTPYSGRQSGHWDNLAAIVRSPECRACLVAAVTYSARGQMGAKVIGS